MASDDRMGYMAVVAVSCGMALVSLQLHKRLTSEFMKKVELSIGGKRPKKKVRFADGRGRASHRQTRRKTERARLKLRFVRRKSNS